jgi:Ca2+-dependent lipid-binding protein
MKAPTWNETFTYNIISVVSFASTVKITVFHEDPKKSEELGSETVFYPLVFANGTGFKDQITLFSKGRAIGKLSLTTTYVPTPVVPQ